MSGGNSWRYKNEENKKKFQEYCKKYSLENKEKLKKNLVVWRKENIEHVRERARAYYRKHREKFLSISLEYRKNNPEKRKLSDKNSKKKHMGRVLAGNMRRCASKINATPKWSDKKEIDNIYSKCSLMSKESGMKYEVDHIWPLRGIGFTGLHVPWNLQILTKHQNENKSNKRPDTITIGGISQ